MSDLGGEVDVQQVAFITLVIMIVLPGTATTGHSLLKKKTTRRPPIYSITRRQYYKVSTSVM
jgi:hypothetical protein